MTIEITTEQGWKIVKELSLIAGSSFTNMEENSRFGAYRVETGYWLRDGNDTLVLFSDTKDSQDKIKTRCHLYINSESFGLKGAV